jgi:VCBS repeat protein
MVDAIRLRSFVASLAALVATAASAQIELAPPIFVPTGDSFLYDLSAADFDEDGHVDLFVAGYPSGLTICLGGGAGAFAARPPIPLPYAAKDALVGDFDEDGHPDVVVLENRRVHVYLGDGQGSLVERGMFRAIDPAERLAAGDLDEDGHLDLVATSGFRSFAVLDGNGDGSFAPPRVTDVASGAVAVADFDGDGHLDLALGPIWGDIGGILLGSGTGRFSFFGYTGLSSSSEFALGDVLEDGRVDLIVACRESPGIYVVACTGFRTFEVFEPDPLLPSTMTVAAGDFDEDGHLDLVSPGPYAVSTTIRPGDGSASFQTVWQFKTGPHAPLVVADFDEDGHVDVASGALGGANVYLNRSIDPDPVRARTGNVNLARGDAASVLLVNGSAGAGDERRVTVDRSEHFAIRLSAPPSHPTGPTPFAVYAWPGEPTRETVNWLPRGVGRIAMRTPLTGGSPPVIWNTIGATPRLGVPTAMSTPAPAILANLPNGLRRTGRAYLQGILFDAAAPNGFAAVTNGIELEVR